MVSFKIDLGKKVKSIQLIPLADMHIGEAGFDEDRFKKVVERIRVTDNAYTIINGDIINNALKTSISDIYAERLSPQDQVDKAIELLMPIKDKILHITGGNHERRSYKSTGLDLVQIMAFRLGLEARYSEGAYLLFVSFGNPAQTRDNTRRTVTIYGKHGSGGGATVGSKANRLEKMALTVDADIFLHSHTHQPVIFKIDKIEACKRTKTIRQIQMLFVNTASFLKFGGYAEEIGLRPANLDEVVIKIDYKNITAEI
jgi:predicted phosphodiesterase